MYTKSGREVRIIKENRATVDVEGIFDGKISRIKKSEIVKHDGTMPKVLVQWLESLSEKEEILNWIESHPRAAEQIMNVLV